MMPESPKYLYSKRDWSKLHQAMKSIAKINGISAFRTEKTFEHGNALNDSRGARDDQNLRTEDFANESEEYSILNALRERRVLVNLVAVVI